ncbi:hypothetical protein [Leucobacter chromiiresistens]|uniref:Uncharacterized protein n=1 Tax=Leucobacter chromiiresistens TaxID=1079994 RepID=A0A1H1ABD7_9MICO|nr:hypothetical protein [Leucobacter chromiiresistens]SDQ36949.1 hypothetical protein SAMN04488565_2482 [Leucobacter chromiiresistens]
MTMVNRPRGGRFRGRASRPRTLRRRVAAALTGFVVGALALSGSIALTPTPAHALSRGEEMTFPGGLTISNFVLPTGERAYCIEVGQHEPSGHLASIGRMAYLPGISGRFPSWEDPHGMRQMNYLIDRHGQSGDAWTAAAVQVTIWRMRENFHSGNAALDRKIGVLMSSARGRALIAESDRLYADAKTNAQPPVAPRAVTGALRVTPDASGGAGRYRVAYPKGATSLSVDGGVFVRNGAAAISVSSTEASARYVQAHPGSPRITVTGTWAASGARGWESALTVHNTVAPTGERGQRIAVAVGSSQIADLTGRFSAATHDVPPPPAPPAASSQAQPDATVGGTMSDRLIIAEAPGTALEMWPDATADFTAYLEPTPGAPKYDEHWNPVLGDPYEVQLEDPETGALVWDEWWTDAAGAPLLDENGDRIPVVDDQGALTSGRAADGTPYPVLERAADGAPKLDATGRPRALSAREAVMEERRDPQTWTETELDAMTEEERCVAQPVHRTGGIPVPGPGEYVSPDTRVRSGGTIHWVERVESEGASVHAGTCGLANETTRIDQPAVVTRAPSEAALGDELFDVATVSGKLADDAVYSLRFEAYRAPDAAPGDAAGAVAAEPTCTAENIVFRFAAQPVAGPGEIRSPGFNARPEHGTTIWWVETLYLETPEGPRVLHRGECGLAHETTTVGRPSVETIATETAPVGGEISDTAELSGVLAENAGARWEMTFAGYRATTATDASAAGEAGGAPEATDGPPQPVCAQENRVFETEPVAVTGPGRVSSPVVVAEPGWAGALWWVETLWLIQGDSRVALHTGACGVATETTTITTPQVTTEAAGFVAVGDRIADSATITGALAERAGAEHRIVFRGYRGDPSATGTSAAQCADRNLLFELDPVPVNAPGTVRSPQVTALPEYGGTIWWVETLSQWEGDVERVLHRGECGVPGETTTVQTPDVRTESAGSVEVGQPMFDTAFVAGTVTERDDVEFRLRFAAYARSASGELVCTPETEILELGDAAGVVVDEAGEYRSRPVETLPRHAGLGGFVETLVMIESGAEHVVARGDCGAPGESFEIRRTGAPALARTGGDPTLAWLVGGSALLLVGAAAATWGIRRRRAAPRVFRECRDLATRE